MRSSVTFEHAADYYDQTRAFPPGEEQHAADVIARAGRLKATDRVLEIGVGTGRIALPLARRVRKLVGVDLARPMMERLQAKRTEEAVALVEGDATRLPLASSSFDAVLSVHVLHLIPDWQAAVAEIARVLKPGAPYIHAWTENFHRNSWWEAWNAATPEQTASGFGLKSHQHRTFLTELGWRPLDQEYAHAYRYLKSPSQFLDQLRQRLWSSTWDLTDEQLEAGIAAVRERMLEETDDLDTPIEHTTHFIARAYLPPA
ncbi:MAG: class I SAM-dependent methyltransferase [Chloroflexota bacterium]|nr:MAG: hypothetical protein DIU68_04690 [Chloroflexota bacterium]